MSDPLEALAIQEKEHQAWVAAAKELASIGFNLNDVDVATFEPARLLLCQWAITYTRGHDLGIFTSVEGEP